MNTNLTTAAVQDVRATNWTGGRAMQRLASSAARSAAAKPTPQQWAVMGFMYAFRADEDRLPTRPEICSHFGWRSVNSADTHINSLVAKGFLEKRGTHIRFARTERGCEALEALTAKEQGEQSPTTPADLETE